MLQDVIGHTIPVKPKNIFQPQKNLGHFKSPAGKYQIQTTKIINKAQSILQAISQSPVSRESARTLYHTVYRPAVEYVLGQSFLNSAQLKTIEKLSLPWIFNKCGFEKTTSRAVLFGPANLGGGGFVPLAAKAGVEYITQFLKFWRTPKTQCGKLF